MSFHRPPVTLDAEGDIVNCGGSPLLAVGSYDGNVRMLSTHSWNVAFLFPSAHPSDMMGGLANDVVTTVEVLESDEGGSQRFDDSASVNDSISSSYSTK